MHILKLTTYRFLEPNFATGLCFQRKVAIKMLKYARYYLNQQITNPLHTLLSQLNTGSNSGDSKLVKHNLMFLAIDLLTFCFVCAFSPEPRSV